MACKFSLDIVVDEHHFLSSRSRGARVRYCINSNEIALWNSLFLPWPQTPMTTSSRSLRRIDISTFVEIKAHFRVTSSTRRRVFRFERVLAGNSTDCLVATLQPWHFSAAGGLIVCGVISCRCSDFSEKDAQDWDAGCDHCNTRFCDVPYHEICGLP